MTMSREEWKARLLAGGEPNTYYAPMDLLNRDRVSFVVGPETESMYRRSFPADQAERLLDRGRLLSEPTGEEISLGMNRFSKWSPSGDLEFNGKGLRKALGLPDDGRIEDVIANPFGCDVIELAGGMWLSPEDVTGVEREQ